MASTAKSCFAEHLGHRRGTPHLALFPRSKAKRAIGEAELRLAGETVRATIAAEAAASGEIFPSGIARGMAADDAEAMATLLLNLLQGALLLARTYHHPKPLSPAG